jgi:hypothetical protein
VLLFWVQLLKIYISLIMTNVFFKFWRIGSLILLSAVFLFCYTNLPENVAIGFNQAGEANSFIGKQHFFYWVGGVILGVNFLIRLLENALIKLDFRKLFSGSSWGSNPNSTGKFLKGWFAALLAFINTYLVFVLLGLDKINSSKYKELDFNYNYLLWVGILILLIILMFLPYKLLATQAPTDED